MQTKLLSTTAFLVAAGIAMPTFAQFTLSLGAQSTQMFVESEVERNVQVPDVGPLPNAVSLILDDSEDNQSTNVGGELALGYQFNYDQTFNVALEIFGQLSSAQVKTPVYANGSDELTGSIGAPVEDATASFDWMAGLRLRPGIYITPAARVFIDGGILWGGFELKQDESVVNFWNQYVPDNFDVNPGLDQTETDTLFGWRYGVGMEYKVTDDLAIGVDYTITEFETFHSDTFEDLAETITNSNNANLLGITASADAEYQPTLHTLGLNFKYLFGAKKARPQQHYEMRDK